MALNYSTRNTYTIPRAASGSYPVTVYALNANQIAAGQWRNALSHTFIVNVNASASVTAQSPVTPTVGQTLSLAASSKNLIQPVYQFWVENPQGQWSSRRVFIKATSRTRRDFPLAISRHFLTPINGNYSFAISPPSSMGHRPQKVFLNRSNSLTMRPGPQTFGDWQYFAVNPT